MLRWRGRARGVAVAVAHGLCSGSLNILLKFLLARYHFAFLTLLQCLSSAAAALGLEALRRRGLAALPPFGPRLARPFAAVAALATLQSTLTLWSLRGLSLPMYVVFKRCLPLVTLVTGALVLRDGMPSPGVLVAVLITTCGAALAGAGDLTGDAMGYVTGVLAVLIHAAYLVLIQKTSVDSEYGPLTAQYAIAVSATPFLIICSFASMDSINVWSFPGWKDPAMVCIFIACVLISCAMNFTTLHCTYINSAVTTSFVGVVKSIATITVGMVAFNDVEPTKLFIAGVVVNTLGSVIYCVAKYVETRRQSNYEDLEKEAREEEGKRQAGDQALFAMETISQGKGAEEAAVEGPSTGQRQSGEEEKDVTEKSATTLVAQGKSTVTQEVNRSSLKEAYLGVWRLVRGANYIKKDYLIENEELPNP
ncbi:solute carrier family 35 member D3 [Ammospiza nelsoni]|uniref:solute carrier family 35 member D3 n=1 Tax=Ammospiza caudacuta TaxID=2857398 RepID=UPI002738B6F1|nr:solute carrier family 35 member D3 [Ammospiza caudacuta]XP_059325231.1 solute carrier family 35 member D3 [Ammospiza nelsoni]